MGQSGDEYLKNRLSGLQRLCRDNAVAFSFYDGIDELESKLATANVAGFGAPPPVFGGRFKSGRYYGLPFTGGNAMVQDRLVAAPFLVTKQRAFTAVALHVSTAVAATSVRVGIYDDDGSAYPGALKQEFGALDSATAGIKEIVLGTALDLAPGLYWLAAVAQGGAPSVYSCTQHHTLSWLVSAAAVDSNLPPVGYIQAGVTGALPANFSTTVTVDYLIARVLLKAQ